MAVKIFCCYAHEDEGLLKKLRTQLMPFQRKGIIEVWHDRDISAGMDWEIEIKKQLESAEIILLLVSSDFMESEYCYSNEMKRALERHRLGKARVISIILRPVHWEVVLGKLQVLPRDGVPVTNSEWQNIDEALFNVAEGILHVVEEISQKVKEPQPSQPKTAPSEVAAQPKKPEVSPGVAPASHFSPSEKAEPVPSDHSKDPNPVPLPGSAPNVSNNRANETSKTSEEPVRQLDNRPTISAKRSSKITKQGKLPDKRLCPSCLHEFYLRDCAIVSRRNGNVLKVASQKTGIRLFSRLQPERLDRPEYVLESATYGCPICRYLLPPNLSYAYDISIATVGTGASGVSHYLATLVHLLREGHLTKTGHHFQLTCLTPNEEYDFMGDKIDPVSRDHHTLPPTLRGIFSSSGVVCFRPLIYELKISSSRGPTQSYNLIFYDVASEDYATPEVMSSAGRNVLSADAIIFFIDPLRISSIANFLPPHLQQSIYLREQKPLYLFNSLLGLCMRYRSVREISSLPMPIALTVSKSDLLQFLPSNDCDILLHDHNTFNGFDPYDAYEVDQTIQKLFRTQGEYAFLNTAQNLPCTQFFAISATGYSPDRSGLYPDIQPYRCLDPLLWILYQLHVI
jgi:hypothetical protein